MLHQNDSHRPGHVRMRAVSSLLDYHPIRLAYSVCFYVFFFVSCLFFFSGAVVLFACTAPFDPNGRVLHIYSCIWAMSYFACNPFWSLRVEHRERIPKNRAAVLVANHISMFDILAIYGLFKSFKWVAKDSLLKVPFVGWNLLLNRHVSIKRGDKKSVAKMMARCERWLQRGVPIMLFPEGTRSLDGSVLPFKDGAFRLAAKMGCPVVPIVVQGTESILPKHGFVMSPRARCTVSVLQPVDSSVFGNDVASMRDHVRQLIMQEKAQMASRLSSRPPPRSISREERASI